MLETIASYIWSAGLLVLLLGTGVFLTIRLRFLQFRGWRTILKRTFGSLKEKPAGENRTALTQFQTFSTALAAAMGTGNIIGVAAALCIGGPGAVFWMWFSALLGMALTYSENVLALRYARTLPDGRRVSGPAPLCLCGPLAGLRRLGLAARRLSFAPQRRNRCGGVVHPGARRPCDRSVVALRRRARASRRGKARNPGKHARSGDGSFGRTVGGRDHGEATPQILARA